MKPKPPQAQFAYRYFKDKGNFEGVLYQPVNGDMVVKWVFAGAEGKLRQPIGTVYKGRIIVTWTDQPVAWFASDVVVSGGAEMPVVLAKG